MFSDVCMTMQVMLGVDRLDMIKGIPQKLLAFEKFLEEHPQWRDKVLLVQIAVPSRTDVPEYQVSLHSLDRGQIAFCVSLCLHVPLLAVTLPKQGQCCEYDCPTPLAGLQNQLKPPLVTSLLSQCTAAAQHVA